MTAVIKPMAPHDFLVWCLDQEDRYELVNGYPIRMMSGGTQAHDDIIVNVIQALGRHLRPPCRVRSADIAAQIPAGNIRRPDVTIDCGKRDRTSLNSSEPRAFFEVLSPSTRGIDLIRKPEEYKRIVTLQHIVLIDPDLPRVWLLSRDGEDWSSVDVYGLSGVIDLPSVGVRLPMSEVYADVELEAIFEVTPP